MNAEKAGTDDIEVLVKMRLNYLLEDNGSLDAQDLAAIKRDLPGFFQAHPIITSSVILRSADLSLNSKSTDFTVSLTDGSVMPHRAIREHPTGRCA